MSKIMIIIAVFSILLLDCSCISTSQNYNIPVQLVELSTELADTVSFYYEDSLSVSSKKDPNPFSPSTRIIIDVPKNENVILSLYDINGSIISKPYREFLPTGKYQVKLNNFNLPSGIYMFRYQIGVVDTKKKVFLFK